MDVRGYAVMVGIMDPKANTHQAKESSLVAQQIVPQKQLLLRLQPDLDEPADLLLHRIFERHAFRSVLIEPSLCSLFAGEDL
jgi:hypothetical protein